MCAIIRPYLLSFHTKHKNKSKYCISGWSDQWTSHNVPLVFIVSVPAALSNNNTFKYNALVISFLPICIISFYLWWPFFGSSSCLSVVRWPRTRPRCLRLRNFHFYLFSVHIQKQLKFIVRTIIIMIGAHWKWCMGVLMFVWALFCLHALISRVEY